jgi:hypothetical protein
MSSLQQSSEIFSVLLKLRSQIIAEHPLNQRIARSPQQLLPFFELYAGVARRFPLYVCTLFLNVKHQDAKCLIHDNLLEELGCVDGQSRGWRQNHGELYDAFLRSLRTTDAYREKISPTQQQQLEAASATIARRFYDAHAALVELNDDCVSIAAFSTIEAWASSEYALWYQQLTRVVNVKEIDVHTLVLHSECDVGHSRILEQILKQFLVEDGTGLSLPKINTGLLRGIDISVALFDELNAKLACRESEGEQRPS